MEKKTNVQIVKLTYTCDKCGKGEMEANGKVLTSMPPWYSHTCNNPECQHVEKYRISYPTYIDRVQ